MFLRNTIQFKGLVSNPIYFFTMKSKRQFTPNLFQNPKLTKWGIFERLPKTYDYNLP